MAQGNSGNSGSASWLALVVAVRAALLTLLAPTVENPTVLLVLWMIVVLCIVIAFLILLYTAFASFVGLGQLRADNQSLRRDKESLQEAKELLRQDKEGLLRDKEALQRENADLQARLRDVQRQTGSFAISPGATYIKADQVVFTPGSGVEVRAEGVTSDPGVQEDEGEPSEPPSRP